MFDFGTALMYVPHEFVCAAAYLCPERTALLLGRVNIFDMAVIGRNAVGDYAVGARKYLLDAGRQLFERRRVCGHCGGYAVDLFGLVPLAGVRGANEGVHYHVAVRVADAYRNYLVAVIEPGELEVEKEHAGAVHAVMTCAVCVALGAAHRHFRFIAGAAELFAVSDILAALYAEQRHADGGRLVVEINGRAVCAARERHRFLNDLKLHAGKAFFGIIAERRGAADADTLDNISRREGERFAARAGSVPQLGVGFGNVFGVEPKAQTVGGLFERDRRDGLQVQLGEVCTREIILCPRFTTADSRYRGA